MSLSTLFDRVVIVRHVDDDGVESARGNRARTTSDLADVPAYRTQVGAEEDTADRDQQARTFEYVLPVFLEDGTRVEIRGRDVIVDGELELEVLGEPELATKRGRESHYLARAFVIA